MYSSDKNKKGARDNLCMDTMKESWGMTNT